MLPAIRMAALAATRALLILALMAVPRPARAQIGAT